MKSIKCYVCECGEDMYEDDEECVNCCRPMEPAKLKDEPLREITSQGPIQMVEMSLDTRNSDVDIRDILRPKS